MSSGEALALCFSSRSNVRSFGEPTSGLTTVTNIYTLRVGSSLNLPVSRMANVNGKPIDGAIRPDVAVPADEWPTSDDATAQTARKWLTENFQ
jgi:C-terminal processing protease CtpA/Prc